MAIAIGPMSPRYRIDVNGAGILRATLGTTFATVLGGALAFGMAVIAARALGPSAKGSYDLLVATGSLGALVLGLAIPTGVTYVAARDTTIAPRVPITAFIASVLVAIGAAATVAVLAAPLAAGGLLPAGVGFEVVVPIGAVAGATFYLAVTRATLVAVLRINAANIAESTGRVIAFAGALILATAGLASATNLVLALAGGLIIGGALQAYQLAPRGWLGRSTTLAIASYSLPSYASTVMQFLNYRLDIFLVAALRGTAEVGLYAAAVLVGQLVWLLARGAALALFPIIAGDANEVRIKDRVGRASRMAALSGIVGAVVLAALGVIVIPALFGTAFQDAVWALWLLLPGIAAFCPVTIAGAYFLGVGRPRLNVAVSALSLVVTLIGDLLLIPRYGMYGAAAASTLSYVAALFVATYLMRRITGLRTSELLLPNLSEVRDLLDRLRRRRPATATAGGE